MKVPAGKVIYIGGKKYQAGDDIPDELAARIEQKPANKPAKPRKPAGDDKPTAKP